MNVHPIKTDADHERALERLRKLWDETDQASRDEVDVLSTLVHAYEETRYPIKPVSAIDAIKFAMEQRGATQADLSKLLSSRSRGAEILNGKRRPTIAMIRLLHAEWSVPLESLVRDADEDEAPKVVRKPKAHRDDFLHFLDEGTKASLRQSFLSEYSETQAAGKTGMGSGKRASISLTEFRSGRKKAVPRQPAAATKAKKKPSRGRKSH